MTREENGSEQDYLSILSSTKYAEYFELIRTEQREDLERKPLNPDTSLRVALDKLPGPWTRGICDEYGLVASTKAGERRKAILDYLTARGSLETTWRRLPEASRRMLRWLVVDEGGSAAVEELYEKFGPDEDYAWNWGKGERPTTPLGLLRLHGLVFKGMTNVERRKVKIAVVPVELRYELKAIASAPGSFEGAPTEPKPAFRRTTALDEILEQERSTGRVVKRVFTHVYQFMVVLEEISPPVWRRIQVPGTYTFWDLHVAIQDAMGWLDYHLHEFDILDPEKGEHVILGIGDDEDIDWKVTLPDHEHRISDYFSMENASAGYLYDFGDTWQHSVTIEAILPRTKGGDYPVCIAGERARPPEDCGGPSGYAEFLEIINDPSHEESEETLAWVGGSFDPERFDAGGVRFDDPAMRWRVAFLDEEYHGAHSGEALSPSPVTYDNRRGHTYYLHSGTSRKGKTTYYFSRKAEGSLVYEIPAGFEIYESPDARVYLRRIQPKIIDDREKEIVESAVRAAGSGDFIVEVKTKTITVFLADLDQEWFSELLEMMGLPPIRLPEGVDLGEILRQIPMFREPPEELLRSIQSYTPLMRFVLEDREKRSFCVERMCFMTDKDDWIFVDGPADLRKLANKYCKHLGRDSFYDL